MPRRRSDACSSSTSQPQLSNFAHLRHLQAVLDGIRAAELSAEEDQALERIFGGVKTIFSDLDGRSHAVFTSRRARSSRALQLHPFLQSHIGNSSGIEIRTTPPSKTSLSSKSEGIDDETIRVAPGTRSHKTTHNVFGPPKCTPRLLNGSMPNTSLLLSSSSVAIIPSSLGSPLSNIPTSTQSHIAPVTPGTPSSWTPRPSDGVTQSERTSYFAPVTQPETRMEQSADTLGHVDLDPFRV